MSIFHYFSKDESKRAKFIFNFIAPLYGKIGKKIAKNYSEVIEIVDKFVCIENKEVLDIGTGSGAWAVKFKELNAKKVIGIDSAVKMINVAKKNFSQIDFIHCDAEELSIFEDNSFDIVTASYVLHGVKKHRRMKMLKEMRRVTRKYVVVNDFAGKVGFFAQMLEALERSDMPYFKEYFIDELKEKFKTVRLIKFQKGGGIYIAEK